MNCDLVPAHISVSSTNFPSLSIHPHAHQLPVPWTYPHIPTLCFDSEHPCHLNCGSPVLQAYLVKSFLAFKSQLKNTSSRKSSLISHNPNYLSSLFPHLCSFASQLQLCYSHSLLTANAANWKRMFQKHYVREWWYWGRSRELGCTGRRKLQCQIHNSSALCITSSPGSPLVVDNLLFPLAKVENT